MRFVVLALLAAVLAQGSPAEPFGSEPSQTLEAIERAQPPVRDLADLRRRVPTIAGSELPSGQENTLWVLDFLRRSYRPAPVELRYASAHADWLVEQGRDGGDLAAAAATFESIIYPRVTALTGVDWGRGSAAQPRLTIFNGRLSGVAGYMSAGDLVPGTIFPYSNNRLIVYMDNGQSAPGSTTYARTLAHELEHLAHTLINPGQQGWLDEGLAELVSNLVMDSPPPALAAVRRNPDVQLNAWGDPTSDIGAHYQVSYLWARYLMERAGGPTALPALLASGGQGMDTVERFVRQQSISHSARELFRDWVLANGIGDPLLGDGRFGYVGQSQRAAPIGTLEPGDQISGSVHQFAADYYELALDGAAGLEIEVSPTVPVLGTADSRGHFFWSVRGDSLNTRLTRQFDLSGLPQANLRFRVWHDLERDYDVCYVLASSDGTVWQPLQGLWTTDEYAVGLGLGPGYTGASGSPAEWRDETVDLSAYAGGRAFIRFECATDQGTTGPGFAVDDLVLPELDFSDGATDDLGWTAEGFVRVVDQMTQPALAVVAEFRGDEVRVTEIPLNASGHGRIQLGPTELTARRPLLAVAGLAPVTLQEMTYRVRLVSEGP